DSIHSAFRHVRPPRVGANGVVLDGRPAQRDLIVKSARIQHVITSETVIADDATALAHAYGRARRYKDRAFEARHSVPKEPVVFPHLATTLDLRVSELLRISGVNVRDPRHVHGDDTDVRRAVPRAFESRKHEVARLGSAAHHRPQPGLGTGPPL